MEEWRNIEGYEGLYKVSNHGRVKSLPREWISGNHGIIRKHNGKILKPGISGGYYTVGLYKNKIEKNILVHRLVALTFIPNDEDKLQVNHIDGNKLNNHVSNLEWNTQKENVQHAYNTGLKISKLNKEQVLEIRASNLSSRKLGKIYNVSNGHISLIKNNKSWKHI